MYIDMENVVIKKREKRYISTSVTVNYAKDAHAHTYTHTHTHDTHTVQTDRKEGQCGLTEIF